MVSYLTLLLDYMAVSHYNIINTTVGTQKEGGDVAHQDTPPIADPAVDTLKTYILKNQNQCARPRPGRRLRLRQRSGIRRI